MDASEGIAIATDFLLGTIAEQWPSEDHCGHATCINLYSLDSVRWHRTLDERMLTQGLEPLRSLACEQLLSASGLGQIYEIPDCGGWQGGHADAELA